MGKRLPTLSPVRAHGGGITIERHFAVIPRDATSARSTSRRLSNVQYTLRTYVDFYVHEYMST